MCIISFRKSSLTLIALYVRLKHVSNEEHLSFLLESKNALFMVNPYSILKPFRCFRSSLFFSKINKMSCLALLLVQLSRNG